MALDSDPYRILGLAAGASLADVKRAYRRLAKANHPDTAGQAAIPRFLAIQAAYEALAGGEGGPGGVRTGPWQAEAERARTTREAWRSRSGASRAGRRPGADQGRGGGAPGTGDPPGGSGGAGPNQPSGGRRRRSSAAGRRPGADRPPGRATPGSTSYDFAEHEPFDPEWSGASWYGQSSGTYWTINPKEYADPRKHGPEYQARARRRQPGGEAEWAAGQSPAEPADQEAPPDPDGNAAPPEQPPQQPAEPRRADAGASRAAASGWSRTTSTPRQSYAQRPVNAPGAGADARRPLDRAADPVVDIGIGRPSGPTARLVLALIGWPPIGLALAMGIGEASGCGRFSATCVEVFSAGSWLAQLVVIAVLLAIPPLAALASVGTVAVLAAAIPAAVVLSAAGGSRVPGAAGPILLTALAVAWVAGIVVAVVRRSRRVPG